MFRFFQWHFESNVLKKTVEEHLVSPHCIQTSLPACYHDEEATYIIFDLELSPFILKTRSAQGRAVVALSDEVLNV